MSSINLFEVKQFMNKQVKILIDFGSSKLKGVMIGNGAAKSYSGIVAFVRYYAHTGIVPNIRPSSQEFTGVGNGPVKSL